MKSPDYSPYAKQYALSRPGYPAELFEYLTTLVKDHNKAWDCATGNGQAALSLTKYFSNVIATDISSEQIHHAVKHKQIEYKVCPADKSGISNNSVNLITVASAVHWFDLNNFYREVQRVIAPGGVLAVWTYHIGYIEPPFDRLFLNFYRNALSPYFGEGAKLVDEKYSAITLPGTPIVSKNFFVSVKWKLSDMLNFIESWSGTQQCKKAKGENPIHPIDAGLKKLWGDPDEINTLRWPLFLKVSQL